MNKQPFFSIAVPTFRRPIMLAECLRSILEQSFSDFEIILGNNDPDTPVSSSTLGIEDPRIVFLNRPKNIGALGNIMDLMHHANGRYVTWLADDDLYLSADFLKVIHAAIEGFDGPDVLFTGFQQKPQPEFQKVSAKPEWRVFTPDQYLHEALQSKIDIIGNYGVWEAKGLKKIGGMKKLGTGYSPYTDTLLGFEAAYLKKILFLEQPLIFFRAHEESHSWTSEDLSGYATAQMDMVHHYLTLADSLRFYPSRNEDLYRLLEKWCIGFFGAVAARSRNPQIKVWPSYFLWILQIGSHLPLKLRGKIYGKAALEIPRILVRRIRRWLRRR